MLNKALYGRLPDCPSALQKETNDSAVKTVADLSQVESLNYANSWKILESCTPIPADLYQLVSIYWPDELKLKG